MLCSAWRHQHYNYCGVCLRAITFSGRVLTGYTGVVLPTQQSFCHCNCRFVPTANALPGILNKSRMETTSQCFKSSFHIL